MTVRYKSGQMYRYLRVPAKVYFGLLAAEFVWARRLMERIKREGGRFKDAVLRAGK